MRALAQKKYDVIVIGGGHNGLVCATYLAKAGKKVLLLERRSMLGGACATEPFPGMPEAFQTTASYVLAITPKGIVEELELFRHGLKLHERDPNAFTPLKDGRYFMRWNDAERTRAEIAKFSSKDAENYPRFEASVADLAEFTRWLMFQTPPDPFRTRDVFKMISLARKALKLGPEKIKRLVDLFSMSEYDYVRRYVTSEPLVATICSDGIIGTCGGPRSPGTAYVLLHHDIGDLGDEPGKWFYVEGGMGAIGTVIGNAARAAGVTIMTDAEVVRVIVEKGCAVGVEAIVEGVPMCFKTKTIVSGADFHRTFRMLDPSDRPAGTDELLSNFDTRSPTWKTNMVIWNTQERHLTWACDYKGSLIPGTIHLPLENTDVIERAYDDFKYGELSKVPVLEICCPTTVDRTLAPPQFHVLSILGQYAPYDTPRELLQQRTLEVMRQYCNIDEVLVTADTHSPKDMEMRFGLTGGNIFQGAMPLNQLFFMRPAMGMARYRTPIKGFWMCGSSCHPGGGVTGIPGHNAAREILKGW
ncbi:MAG: NAD(P)/FAD-dependent oxidoreductase [Patescibacteria group bacterium]|jgi:phytoene dehydrogenase-like protein